jgi:tetratricopeptide (TPR) repeat protein
MAEIFISYSTLDIERAEELARIFEACGRTVWYDREIKAGDDFREQIARELDVSHVVIVIWTANSVRSQWVISEAQRAHRAGKLVPVRSPDIDEGLIPQPFDTLHTVTTQQQVAIINAINAKRQLGIPSKPSGAQELPALTSTGDIAIRTAARTPVRAASNMQSAMPTRPARCVGQSADVERIARSLARELGSVIVFGGPGLGKTTLTREVACHQLVLQKFGHRRYFIELEHANTIEDLRNVVSSALGRSGEVPLSQCLSIESEPILLILDNFETPWEPNRPLAETELKSILDGAPNVAVLVSVRGAEVPHGLRWSVKHQMGPLSEADARELFLDIAFTISPGDPCLPPLITSLGGVPLAIELAAFEASAFHDLSDVWSEWQRLGTSSIKRSDVEEGRTTSVEYSIAMSLNSSRRRPRSLEMFSLIAFLDSGIEKDILRTIFENEYVETVRDLLSSGLALQRDSRIHLLPPIRDYGFRNQRASETLLKNLVAAYLLHFEKASTASNSRHEAIVEWIRAEHFNLMSIFVIAVHRADLARLLIIFDNILETAHALQNIKDHAAIIRTVRAISMVYDFLTACAIIDADFKAYVQYILHSAECERIIGRFLIFSHLNTVRELEDVLESCPVSFRPKVEDAIDALRKMYPERFKLPYENVEGALDAKMQAERAHGKAFLDQVLGLSEEQLKLVPPEHFVKPENPNRLPLSTIFGPVIASLAQDRLQEGQHVEAAALYQRLHSLNQMELGNEHIDTATSLHELARTYSAQQRYSEAETYFLEVMRRFEAISGGEDANVATTLVNLSEVYWNQGRLAEAEKTSKRALAINEKVFGPLSSQLVYGLSLLGHIFESEEKFPESEELFRRALKVSEVTYGAESVTSAEHMVNLGRILSTQWRTVDAEALLRRALCIREETFGGRHVDTVTVLNMLADLMRDRQGRYRDAEPLYRRAYEINFEVLGEEHPSTAESIRNLASIYRLQGQYSESEGLYRRAFKLLQAADVRDDAAMIISGASLALLLRDMGRTQEALSYFTAAYESALRTRGEDDFLTIWIAEEQAELHLANRNVSEAQAILRRTLEFWEKNAVHKAWSARAYRRLAELELIKSDASKALSFGRRAIAIQEELLSAGHPDLAYTRYLVGAAKENLGLLDEALSDTRVAVTILEKELSESHPRLRAARSALARLSAKGRRDSKEGCTPSR